MPRKDLPCNRCGKMMMRGSTSLPEGQARCHPCRRIVRDETPKPPGPKRQSRSRICEVCSAPYKANYTEQRTCGRACGMVIHARVVIADPPSCPINLHQCGGCDQWTSRPNLVVCGPDCRKARERARYVPAPLIREITCRDCFAVFTHTRAQGPGKTPWYCSDCVAEKKRARSSHRRRMLALQWVEQVNRRVVYERDGWTCGICGDAIDRDADKQSNWAPSLDHIVPLSLGGQHSYANTRAAHRWCNSVRGATDLDLSIA